MTNTFQHTAKSASCPPPIAKAPLAVAHAAQILVVFSLGLNFFRSGCCSQKTRTHIYIHCIYRREILLKTAAAKGKIMAETIKHSVTVFFFFPAPVSIFRPLPFSLLLSLLTLVLQPPPCASIPLLLCELNGSDVAADMLQVAAVADGKSGVVPIVAAASSAHFYLKLNWTNFSPGSEDQATGSNNRANLYQVRLTHMKPSSG